MHIYTHTHTTHKFVVTDQRHTQQSIYVCVHIYIYTCIYIHVYTRIYIYMYICIYIYTHLEMYINIYCHVHSHTLTHTSCLWGLINVTRSNSSKKNNMCVCTYIYMHIYVYTYTQEHIYVYTGWRRLIGSPKLQIIFHKRATKYRSLLRKMTYEDKASYESSPPCVYIYIHTLNVYKCILSCTLTHTHTHTSCLW